MRTVLVELLLQLIAFIKTHGISHYHKQNIAGRDGKLVTVFTFSSPIHRRYQYLNDVKILVASYCTSFPPFNKPSGEVRFVLPD